MKTITCTPRFQYTSEEIKEETQRIVAECRQQYDKLGRMDPEEANFVNVVRRMNMIDAESNSIMNILCFLQHASPDKDVRNASRECQELWQKFQIESAQREDIYRLFKEVEKWTENPETLDFMTVSDRRVLEKMLQGYRRMGMELPSEKRNRLKKLLDRQTELNSQFDRINGEDDSYVILNTYELPNMEPDYLERTRIADTNTHKITGKYPDVYPILDFCSLAETRKKVMLMFEGRSQDNLPILAELTKVRQEMAELLGYAHNADFRCEIQMAKSGQRVSDFLDEVLTRLAPKCREYVSLLEQQKSQPLEYWDYSYYHQLNLKENYAVDNQKLKEYFPTDHVVAEMLRIYAEIFHLTFEECSPESYWYAGNPFFEVRDADDPDLVLGYFYLDLYPREGKYPHAAMWDLIPGHRKHNGVQTLALATLLCNFPPAKMNASDANDATDANDANPANPANLEAEARPSLLSYQNVTTLFHEFGHVIHGICGGRGQRWVMLSGTNVETDFVEAPSQMIEQWLWEPVVLRRVTRHYKTGESIPEDLLKSLIASRYVGKARDWTRQAVLAKVDQVLHSRGDWSVAGMKEAYCKISDQYMGYSCGTGRFLASWAHLAHGYDAKYYSYVWSRVIAADLYSRFLKNGNPLDSEIGRQYRRCILEPGGRLDGDQMVRNFLNRDMQIDAFLRTVGVDVDVDVDVDAS